MGKINYKGIYDYNRRKWEGLTDEPEKYEALLAGHYSDSNHFVYELLQNAEDADASKVVMECYSDKLIFYHNGTPFNEADVRGVSSMLMGTKAGKSDKNSGQKIGHFGMGFKSVFKYTNQPEIYSDYEAFRIERYLLPVELNNGWNFDEEKKSIKFKVLGGSIKRPFEEDKHLTKIIIPFTKKDIDGNVISMPSKDVVSKLRELDGRILLFLTTIKELYWIDKTTNEYMLISLDIDSQDDKLVTCRREGTKVGDKELIERYLKFTNVFDHEKMTDCNVSVAFRVNKSQGKLHVTPLKNQSIWVYFPTKDETVLPFLIHGSFETAVSREKLMDPSSFNDDLYRKLIELICDSLSELKKRGLISQSFIRQILIPAFEDEHFSTYDEDDEEWIRGLEYAVTERFLNEELLPDNDGGYGTVDELAIPVPYVMADIVNLRLFDELKNDIKRFVQFGDNSAANFNDYFTWLRDDLGVEVFSLESLAALTENLTENKIIEGDSDDYKSLEEFYDFISDYRESVYASKNNAQYYSRTSAYENDLRNCIRAAWESFRCAPIILNRCKQLVPAFIDNNANIYLDSTSEFSNVVQESLIHEKLAKGFKTLFEDGFGIVPFNNQQYVKEQVLDKYVEKYVGRKINVSEEDYLLDIRMILGLIDDGIAEQDVKELVKDARIIRVLNDEDYIYVIPSVAYPHISEESVDLSIYMAGIDDYYLVDEKYYELNDISVSKLSKLGMKNQIVTPGVRSFPGYQGSPAWSAKGEYCPNIEVFGWDDNLYYIEEFSETVLAKQKSAEMLFWALRNYNKLSGIVSHNKTNTYTTEENSKFLSIYIKNTHWKGLDIPWVLDANEEWRYPTDISKFELNSDVYGSIEYSKEAYSVLGFIEKRQDETADAFKAVSAMDNQSQERLLKQLARKFGYSIEKENQTTSESDDVFNPDSWQSTEFPSRRVKNTETLQAHVREQFFCADPTKYKQVLRQIRISKNSKMVKEYVSNMYTNIDGVRMCQMCMEPAHTIEAIEIANLGIEMDQLHLALCPNCAMKYKEIRDKDKESFKESIIVDLKDLYIDYEYDDPEENYELDLTDEESIVFTQTHLAEIQEIFSLLEEYGLPDADDIGEVQYGPLGPISKQNITEENTNSSDELIEELRVEEGSFVTYKKVFSGEFYDNVMQPQKYDLHKALLGAKVGDTVSFRGKQYEITAILGKDN